MEDRLISANKLKAHYAWWGLNEATREAKDLFDDIVDAQPTVEAEPIRHGKWEICAEAPTYSQKLICSICRVELPLTIVDEYGDMLPYCPHCGAKMESEEK